MYFYLHLSFLLHIMDLYNINNYIKILIQNLLLMLININLNFIYDYKNQEMFF